jgi:Mrp family chromosome partitioning ATPase
MAGAATARETLEYFGPAALLGGLAVAALREINRNTITSLSSLGKHRDYPVLGAAPVLTEQVLRELPPDQRTPLGCLAFLPASIFSTAFRDLQGALAEDQVVAFIAPFAGEGASTAALATAVSAQQQGRRVILLDCDLRRRTFSTAFEHDPPAGVLEACEHPDDWRHFIDEEVETGLNFIPAARPKSPWRMLAGAPGLPLLIDRLRDAYDLVVLDCPAALASSDGPVVARMADRCVVVAAWDATPISAVRDTMRALRARMRAAAGILVNRVPPGYRFGRLRPS